MAALFLKKINSNILVTGPLYNKKEKIEKILQLSIKYDYVIINGNLCYHEIENLEENFLLMKQNLFSKEKIIYNISSDDLIFTINNKKHYITNWINNQPNIIFLEFKNQTNTIITNGGLLHSMRRSDLINNIETTFISNINGLPWHKKYNGNFGYVISNNPLTCKYPQFFPYSLQMGNKFECDKIYAQEVGPKGLKQTILL